MLWRMKGNQSFDWFLFFFLYPVTRFARGYKKRTQLALSSFYTPKRFRTAVAGMKIPSPGPLDDRGVLCGDKYRILLDYVKGAFFNFFCRGLLEGNEKGLLKSKPFPYTLCRGLLEGIKKEPNLR